MFLQSSVRATAAQAKSDSARLVSTPLQLQRMPSTVNMQAWDTVEVCVQLHRPHLVKFWLPVLIAHLASPQLVVARNCLGILCAFSWINTLHAVPAYLRAEFEQGMAAFERNVDSWQASGELEGARADGLRFLVASKFWHLPSASTAAEFPGMPEMRDVRVTPPPPEVGRLHNLAINEVRKMRFG